MENPAHSFKETNLVLELILESQTKYKTVIPLGLRKKRENIFLYILFCPKEIILTFVFYFNLQLIESTIRIYIFYIPKNITFTLLLLVLKIVESLSVSLKDYQILMKKEKKIKEFYYWLVARGALWLSETWFITLLQVKVIK